MQHANNNGADQPAHARSLISTIDARCMESIIGCIRVKHAHF